MENLKVGEYHIAVFVIPSFRSTKFNIAFLHSMPLRVLVLSISSTSVLSHPLLIKELINKFSHDQLTNGQLIFSAHESSLLNQDIFRPDEIWFAEKNKEGATEIYALSEFKEHHTIDIRKGYLNGRYAGILF